MKLTSLFCAPCVAMVLGLSAPAAAYNVFLDYNTDGLITTFNNQVTGPVSVAVDIVVEILPADLGISFLQVNVAWGYGGSSPS